MTHELDVMIIWTVYWQPINIIALLRQYWIPDWSWLILFNFLYGHWHVLCNWWSFFLFSQKQNILQNFMTDVIDIMRQPFGIHISCKKIYNFTHMSISLISIAFKKSSHLDNRLSISKEMSPHKCILNLVMVCIDTGFDMYLKTLHFFLLSDGFPVPLNFEVVCHESLSAFLKCLSYGVNGIQKYPVKLWREHYYIDWLVISDTGIHACFMITTSDNILMG